MIYVIMNSLQQSYRHKQHKVQRGKIEKKKVFFSGKKNVKNANILILNNVFLNNEQVTEEIKREIKKIPGNK